MHYCCYRGGVGIRGRGWQPPPLHKLYFEQAKNAHVIHCHGVYPPRKLLTWWLILSVFKLCKAANPELTALLWGKSYHVLFFFFKWDRFWREYKITPIPMPFQQNSRCIYLWLVGLLIKERLHRAVISRSGCVGEVWWEEKEATRKVVWHEFSLIRFST